MGPARVVWRLDLQGMSVINMNIMDNNTFDNDASFDADVIDISKSSLALAKNLRSQLGYNAACKTCAQNHWSGVLAALHILEADKSPINKL